MEAQNKKTIFYVIPFGPRTDFVLRTDSFRMVKKDPRVHVVIISPFSGNSTFQKEFGGENVSFEPWPNESNLRLIRFLNDLRGLTRIDKHMTETIYYQYLEKKRNATFKYKLMLIASAVLSRSVWFWDFLEDLFFRDPYYSNLVETYHPDLICIPSPGVEFFEVPFIIIGRRKKVPVMAVDTSWDAMSSKYFDVRKIDLLILWNEVNKAEAIKYRDYEPERIIINNGTPRFDCYATHEGLMSRENFFRSIGADPSKKLVTFILITDWMYPFNQDVVMFLKNAVKEKKFSEPIQLLVSLPFKGAKKIYTEMCKDVSEVIIHETPQLWSTDEKQNAIGNDFKAYVMNMIYHADIVLNVASTTSIEGAIVDKPIINIAFDMKPMPYERSVERYYKSYLHYVHIVNTGGVRLATSLADLIVSVNEALENPSNRTEGRKKIIEVKLGVPPDGHAGERVAKIILECVGLR